MVAEYTWIETLTIAYFAFIVGGFLGLAIAKGHQRSCADHRNKHETQASDTGVVQMARNGADVG